ncbi:PTS system, cellobiose-specific IIA component [Seinonella peptonophila]|uniref:PTS system lactose-specific EIIA component n=1 Tax=Seinonella peptonophila TaxID=112248 RepID=A0A1M5A7X7_9BACL|nr:PTS lactose/cellobiose transporter subunit IIA [Seinonella peptonophila]SHF26349.1 PTS system, cellobiose-specific IIA component [Seinonella peptonophila]
MDEQIPFQIISYAGDSFSKMMEALQEAKQGNFDKVDPLFAEAEQLLHKAHQVQTDLIVKEANGENNEFSVLLVHAQDTLMNTILSSTLIKELIEVYQRGQQT